MNKVLEVVFVVLSMLTRMLDKSLPHMDMDNVL